MFNDNPAPDLSRIRLRFLNRLGSAAVLQTGGKTKNNDGEVTFFHKGYYDFYNGITTL
jgi:hypothetical protein